MTNPSDMVRVRARNGGRASVYEANGWCQAYTSGLLEGEGVTQNTSADMNVLVGGSTTKPDVVLAENAAGYRIALDIVSQEAITITAPAANSRITAIVAYTDDLSLSSSEDTVTGSPASCGLIAVNGTTAASPVAPTDTQIRSAITTDGATGSQAAYCVIATIAVDYDTTAIDDSMITVNSCELAGSGVVKADNIDFTTLPNYSTEEHICGQWVDGSTLYEKTIVISNATKDTTIDYAHSISNFGIGFVVDMFVNRTETNATRSMNYFYTTSAYAVAQVNSTFLSYRIPATEWGWSSGSFNLYARIRYTKSS